MNDVRQCCRPGCSLTARATLTFDYASSTAVVGPLSRGAEPHSWDLCEQHADRITVPRGWELVRAMGGYASARDDDLTALAEAVRETSGSAARAPRRQPELDLDLPEVPMPVQPAGRHRPRPGRRGHLRVLPDLD